MGVAGERGERCDGRRGAGEAAGGGGELDEVIVCKLLMWLCVCMSV